MHVLNTSIIRRAFGPWRCEIPSFAFDKPIYSFKVPRARRGGATRGQMAYLRATSAAGPILEMGPKTGQKLTTIDFWPPGCRSKNDPFSDPFKIDPGGWQSRPLPALGGQWLHFSFFWGPFWEPFYIIFLILFQTPQNLDFALPYCTFASFKYPKSSHFGTPFR